MRKVGNSGTALEGERDSALERASLARKLRELRAGAGLSQQLLGAALGRPQSYVSKIEGAQRRVELQEIQDWARACGKVVRWSFVDDPAPETDDTPEAAPARPPEADLAARLAWLIPRLSAADRALLETTLRYLMERQDTHLR